MAIRGATESFLLQGFAGSVPLYRANAAGSPDVRYRDLPVALPDESGNTVRLIASEYEDLEGSDLAPVPRIVQKGDLPESVVYEKDPERYATGRAMPAAIVELSPLSHVRSVVVGSIRVFPLQYNPASHTVRKYTRVVVELVYGTTAGRRIEKEDQALFRSALLNYDITRQWTGSAAKVAAAVTPSVLSSGSWYRLTTKDEGMYRLDAAALSAAGISLTGIDPRTIKVYGNGGEEVPEDVAAVRPSDLTEVAVYVEGESDGQFNTGDYIVFYGKSVRGWGYDPSRKSLRHYLNHYSENNYYWLTYGGATGKRMAVRPSDAGTPQVVKERFVDALLVEEEKVNILRSGKDWLGQAITGPTGSFTHVNLLPGLIPGETIQYRYRLVSNSVASAAFTVREGSTVLGAHTLPRIYSYLYGTQGIYEVSGASTLANSTSQLSFSYSSSDVNSTGYIDWIEVRYPRLLWGVNGFLRFRSPDTTGIVEYQLQQFSTQPMVFDVTHHSAVQLISGIAGSYTFRSKEQAGTLSEYCAVAPTGWKSPAAIEKIANQDLRGYTNGAQFIILTSQEYLSAAQRLKDFREQSTHGDLRTLIVDVGKVYNEFAGGIPDITAIRDYLKYAYDNWVVRPEYVLFLGGASYDYKGLLGSKSSLVPTWESSESLDDVDSYATDDFFAKFEGSDRISLVLGRIPSRTLADASVVVDKVIRYENSSIMDGWKTRMLFVGDDAWTPEGGEVGDMTIHSEDAERLSSSYYTPDEFEKKKIYIAEYPTVNTSQGRRKPGAYEAIIEQINQGVLIANYSGHGNPSVWAHERIFEVGTSIPQLFNRDRLSVYFLATCNFSVYDDPKTVSGGELMVNRAEGGGVGVVSASRKVYAGANAALNQGTYQRMFTRDAYGRLVVERPAKALFLYKVASGNFENDQKFFYLGDPTMRLQFPQRYAAIDTIDGVPVNGGGGQTVQLKSLSRVTLAGTIRDQSNGIDRAYAGKATLIVNDATHTQTVVNFYPGYNWDYLASGGVIYRGENTVSAGRFSASFIVPKDISYADSSSGRLVAYFAGSGTDGVGYTGAVRVGGTDTTVATDMLGPRLSIYLQNRSFRPGDVVDEKPTLIVDLADSSGINTSGSGIGHRIEAWLNDASQSIDLTDYYNSSLDNFREGTIQYPLRNLPYGKNKVRVRAWDSYNNSSTQEVNFEVASSGRLAITDVLNYPNPFAATTEFTFRHNYSGPLDVTVKIYTVAGRLIQTLQGSFLGDLFIRLPWDGRDRDGDTIANGIYLYKVIAKTADGAMSAEALGKLTLIR
jgi:hypothetical protein